MDYRALFRQAPDAVLVTDAKGRYIEVNEAACSLTGYTREELLSMGVGDLTIPSDRPLSSQRFELLRQEGRTRQDRILLRKDGTQLPVEAHAAALGNGHYQTFIRDISARMEAYEALQRSHRAYTTLVEVCRAGVISADVDGNITSWNEAAVVLFGYTEEQALGMPLVSLIPERLRRRHIDGYRSLVSAAGDVRVNKVLNGRALRNDGSEFPVEISVASAPEGERAAFVAVVRDMTVHQVVVERLNDALQRLQFHVQRMPLGYIVWDIDFRVQEWNPAAARLFGYTKEEAMGRAAYELIVPPDVVKTVDKVWADLLKGERSSHAINQNVRKDGTRLTCEWFNTPLRDSEGGIHAVASMVMDVSERETIEARIRNAQKLESLGVLAGGVAHDFNSTLMVILGNTSLLRSMKGLPSKAKQHIELIEEAGARGDALVKHLLAYARTGRHNPQPTNVNRVIEEAMTFIRSSLGGQYQLRVELAGDLPMIRADRSQLEQILLNLSLNAKQAMPEGGTVELRTRVTRLTSQGAAHCVPYDIQPGRYVEITLSDTGCGMDEATLLRVFDPFFTTKAQGHGLGLAAVLGILRQHNAAVCMDSTPGVGTVVHVYFPILEDTPKVPEKRSEVKSEHKPRSRVRPIAGNWKLETED